MRVDFRVLLRPPAVLQSHQECFTRLRTESQVRLRHRGAGAVWAAERHPGDHGCSGGDPLHTTLLRPDQVPV